MRDCLHAAWGAVVVWLVVMRPWCIMLWWFRRRHRREARRRLGLPEEDGTG